MQYCNKYGLFPVCCNFVLIDQTQPVRSSSKQLSHHGETILIVEDELPVLNLCKNLLEARGYSVLAANSPDDAIQLAVSNDGKIDLLITDVIMPKMNGRELATKLHDLYPDMKTMFMSGYTYDVIIHHSMLEENVPFISKPFSARALVGKVHDILTSKKE